MVDGDDDMNIILYTWELNLKRLPDGLVKKCKAQLCACGDQNFEGLDLFETHSTVVKWKTF